MFAGHAPLPGAIEAVAALPADRIRYVTNNASRRPAEVAVHLREIGFDATPQQVVTSAQAGARLVAEQVPAGSTVLVVGTDGLAAEVAEVGLVPTAPPTTSPVRSCRAIRRTPTGRPFRGGTRHRGGALWVATNVDPTLPNERGFLIGNGSMVAAVASATKATPQVAGKPARLLLRDAIADVASDKPLVVGDRLDTDIEGANAVGADSLLVLTGVSTLRDVLVAAPEQRRRTSPSAWVPWALQCRSV